MFFHLHTQQCKFGTRKIHPDTNRCGVKNCCTLHPRAGCFIIFSFLSLKMTGCNNLYKGHCLDNNSQQSAFPAKPPVVLKYRFQQSLSFFVFFFFLENLGWYFQLNKPALLTGVDMNIWTKKHKCGRHLKAIWSSWNACKILYTWREIQKKIKIAFKESRGWIFPRSNAKSFSQWYKSNLSYKPDTDPNHKSMAERKGEKR